jgi:LPS-assembly lipoprotein
MRRVTANRLIWVWLGALALMGTGCGFYLRGTRSMDFQLAKIFVQSQAADQLAAEVKQELGYNGVTLAGGVGKADAVVVLSHERLDQRVLSVDPQTGKVRELQLGYAVDLNVTERDGRSLITPQTVSLVRDLIYDETAAIGTFEQVNLLHNEMRKDAVETVLLRLQTIKLK